MAENSIVEDQSKALDHHNLNLLHSIADAGNYQAENNGPGLISVIRQYDARLAEYKEKARSIAGKLSQLQDLTEEAFLKIGNNLPGINDNLSGAGGGISGLLDYFKKETGFLGGDGKDVAGDLDRLNYASQYLIKVAQDQSDAFLRMGEMIKRIENIRNSIESIRDFSIEMEMLSMNAAIVAIKAGESGRTLNPITSALKSMANLAISVIDEIVNTAEELIIKYGRFQELSETQAKSCKSDIEKLNRQLSTRYSDLQASIMGLVDRLDQTFTVIGSTKEPISKIMNTLQVQDILKQCTDHVRLSLDEVGSEAKALSDRSAFTGLNPEQILDIIAFQGEVPMLCIQLLDDIDDRLRGAIADLGDGFGTIKALLLDVASSQQGKGLHGDGSSLLEVEQSFKVIEEIILETSTMMRGIASSWDQLWATAKDLEEMLGTLEVQFKRLKKVTKFHSINIPIKIEVARSPKLSDNGELSQRVEGLAGYISSELQQSYKNTVQDRRLLSEMVASIGKFKNDVEVNLKSITTDIDDLHGSFNRAKNQVEITFSGIQAYTSELLDLVQASLLDLDKINRLIDQNIELKDDFMGLASLISGAKDSIQSEIGAVDWQLHDRRLNEIVKKFTVLAHKKIAESLFAIDVEDGTQEGDVILF